MKRTWASFSVSLGLSADRSRSDHVRSGFSAIRASRSSSILPVSCARSTSSGVIVWITCTASEICMPTARADVASRSVMLRCTRRVDALDWRAVPTLPMKLLAASCETGTSGP